MRATLSIGWIVILVVLFFGCAEKESRVGTIDQLPPPLEETSASEPLTDAEAAGEPLYLPTATVTASRLDLREQSTPQSEVLAVLRGGDRLEVLSRSSDWLEVRTPEGKIGWINGEHVDVVDEAEGRPLEASDPALTVLTPPPESAIVEEALGTTAPEPVGKLPPTKAQQTLEALRKELEGVWNNHRRAYAVGDMALLKKTSSDYSYGTMRNALASAGKALNPEELTFFYELMPDVASLKFVELKKMGPTAGLIYVGEAGEGSMPGQPPQPGFLFIKFVQEGRGWTVDGMQATPAPDPLQDGGQTAFDPAALPTELAIDGVVRPAPEAVKMQ